MVSFNNPTSKTALVQGIEELCILTAFACTIAIYKSRTCCEFVCVCVCISTCASLSSSLSCLISNHGLDSLQRNQAVGGPNSFDTFDLVLIDEPSDIQLSEACSLYVHVYYTNTHLKLET
jgi:hypothetical protein